MSPVQMKFVPIFGWGCIGVVSFLAAILILGFFIKAIIPLFSVRSLFETSNCCDRTPFSDVGIIDGYVPSAAIPGYLSPFLLCDVNRIDDSLIGWKQYSDSSSPSERQSLKFDCERIVQRRMCKAGIKVEEMFSRVQHWPCQDIDSNNGKANHHSYLSCSIFSFLFDT
jgi:hypothetical protein